MPKQEFPETKCLFHHILILTKSLLVKAEINLFHRCHRKPLGLKPRIFGKNIDTQTFLLSYQVEPDKLPVPIRTGEGVFSHGRWWIGSIKVLNKHLMKDGVVLLESQECDWLYRITSHVSHNSWSKVHFMYRN